MTCANVGETSERLLNPELLQLNLASALLLLLKLDGLLCLVFDGRTSAAVLKLDLCTESPALAEVVTKIDNGMRYVWSFLRELAELYRLPESL